MDSDVLSRVFENIGARVEIVPVVSSKGKSPRLMVRGNRPPADGVSVEVKRDARGLFFEIRTTGKVKLITTDGPINSNSLFLFAETKKEIHAFSCGRTGNSFSVYKLPQAIAKKELKNSV